MRMMRKLGFAALLGVFVLASGCGGDTSMETVDAVDDGGNARVTSELAGEVAVDGSSTVYPIAEAIADGFRESFPKVKVTVGVSGTGGGFKRFTKGETDISDASRPIKSGEFDRCKENGVHFVEVPVAYDGLTIVVNKENDWIDQITMDEIKKIFRAPGAKTWKEVNDAWPAEQIKIYAPGTDSGTFDYFKEVVVGKDEGVSIRDDMSVSEDDNVLVTGVSGERTAIGFFGAAYFFENQEKLKALEVVNSDGIAVSPEPKKIESGEYNPFSRPLFIYVNVNSLDRPEVEKFVGYFLANASEAAQKVGYVALPEEVYDEAAEHIENRILGTHYLTKDGDKVSGAVPDIYKPENALGTGN